MLAERKGPIARALRDADPCYAASTYALCGAIYAKGRKIRAMMPMYTHLDGTAGLASNDEQWLSLHMADRTGFRGITSSSLVTVDCDPGRFTVDGHCAYNHAKRGLEAQDSDVVCFMPREDDETGSHSPVLISEGYAAFPPNTLYRLVEQKGPGTGWHRVKMRRVAQCTLCRR